MDNEYVFLLTPFKSPFRALFNTIQTMEFIETVGEFNRNKSDHFYWNCHGLDRNHSWHLNRTHHWAVLVNALQLKKSIKNDTFWFHLTLAANSSFELSFWSANWFCNDPSKMAFEGLLCVRCASQTEKRLKISAFWKTEIILLSDDKTTFLFNFEWVIVINNVFSLNRCCRRT